VKLDFDLWAARNAALWLAYLQDKDAQAFISNLKKENAKWIAVFVEMGYRASGGSHDGTLKSANDYVVAFINGFAETFLQDLLNGRVTDERGAWRAFLYASEGSRMAYMLGQQQAMRERGAKSWRRILHPESTESGPCQLCINDSMLVHSIDEAFVALHPYEACTIQTIDYYPSERGEVDTESPFKVSMPVPNRFPPFENEIKKALGALGDKTRSIVRRVAPREVTTTTSPIVIPSPSEMTEEAIAPIVVLVEEERKKKERNRLE